MIAGLAMWATPAVPAATAIVAQADQVLVAVREDASVAISEHVLFASDGTRRKSDRARRRRRQRSVDGLCVIKAVAQQEASKSSKS